MGNTVDPIEIGIVLIVIVVLAWAVSHVMKKMRRGGGCCGEYETAEKKVSIADKNKKHYPYAAEIKIEGMVCENCSRRVENAFNALEGVWAKVDMGQHSAKVYLKDPPDKKVLSKVVREAGYILSDMKILSDEKE